MARQLQPLSVHDVCSSSGNTPLPAALALDWRAQEQRFPRQREKQRNDTLSKLHGRRSPPGPRPGARRLHTTTIPYTYWLYG